MYGRMWTTFRPPVLEHLQKKSTPVHFVSFLCCSRFNFLNLLLTPSITYTRVIVITCEGKDELWQKRFEHNRPPPRRVKFSGVRVVYCGVFSIVASTMKVRNKTYDAVEWDFTEESLDVQL